MTSEALAGGRTEDDFPSALRKGVPAVAGSILPRPVFRRVHGKSTPPTSSWCPPPRSTTSSPARLDHILARAHRVGLLPALAEPIPPGLGLGLGVQRLG